MSARDLLLEIPAEKRDKVIEYSGHLYATLDWEPPKSTRQGPTELPECVALPDGWELSSDTAEIAEAVAAPYPWGTSLLVTRTGAGFTTAGWAGQSGSKISNYELACVQGNLFGPRRALPSRPSRVLIRYPAGVDPDLPKLVAGPPSFQNMSDIARGAKSKARPSPSPSPSPLAPKLSGEAAAAALPVALLFPGQGSQYVGMLNDVKDLAPVQEMLRRAQEILGYDLLELCLKGPEEKLEETRYCQPAMFVAGLAAVESLRGQRQEAVSGASAMAGLSLGEYTALCAAGTISFEEGLRLVSLRGEAMQEAATVGRQLMLSVAGMGEDELHRLCDEAEQTSSNEVCRIANHLFPNGYSVGGTEKAINLLKDSAEKAGALQAKVLKTSGAFHTSLMHPAAEKLAAALDKALPSMKPPRCEVWMNASAEPVKPGCDPTQIVELLKMQLTKPVLWYQSVNGMIQDGITEFYEVGPQKQLKAMMKRIDQESWKRTTNVTV